MYKVHRQAQLTEPPKQGRKLSPSLHISYWSDRCSDEASAARLCFGGGRLHARLATASQIHFSSCLPFMRDVSHDQCTVETDGGRRKHVAIGEIARVRPLNLKGRDAPRIRLEDHTIEPAARRGDRIADAARLEE